LSFTTIAGHQQAMEQCPQEVLDCIIDHLHNDKQSLSTCASTYRLWQTAAHHHLFAFARLRNVQRCKSLLEIAEGRPGIGTNIRFLAITDDDDSSNSISSWMKVYFDRLAPHLVNVATMTIRSLNFEQIGSHEILWSSLGNMTSVREIYLYMSTFEDIQQVGRLLHSFPALEEFDFWWNNWHHQEPRASLTSPYLPSTITKYGPLANLRVVSIGECPYMELAAWLLCTRSARSIKLLSFNLSELDLVKASSALMREAAGSLEQLCIDCVTFPKTPSIGTVSTIQLSWNSGY
jgi:hypothetical protein